jgi:hypothetical protein
LFLANQQIEKQRKQTLKDAQRSQNKSQYSSMLNAHDKTSSLRKSGSWSDLNGAGAHPSQYSSLENGHYTASSALGVNGLTAAVSSTLPTNNSQLYRQLSCNRGFLVRLTSAEFVHPYFSVEFTYITLRSCRERASSAFSTGATTATRVGVTQAPLISLHPQCEISTVHDGRAVFDGW